MFRRVKNEIVVQEISSGDFENIDLSASLHPLGDRGWATPLSGPQLLLLYSEALSLL